VDRVDHIVRRSRFFDAFFAVVGGLILVAVLIVLFVLIGDLFYRGFDRINWQFLTSFPSRFAERAGILSALVGSILVLIVTAVCSIPLGIAAGLYLEEYAPKNRLTALIEINISNLASVPSIIYGLMALGLFVYKLNLGQSILAAGLTLGLLVLPIVIVTTREAIRSVPQHIREAAFAVGATKWQVVRDHVLPYSSGGIMTGVIIALSRAIGETAPLVTIGALTFISFLPSPPLTPEPPFISFKWLMDPFAVLPIQMFNWISRPQEGFHVNAAAVGVVILIITLGMNAAAILIRWRFRRRIKW